jgi:hypothetical protein
MKVSIELEGNPNKIHCSEGSSINSCQYLNSARDRCKLFKTKLKYDWDSHSCKRCQQCLDNEVR